MNDEFLKKIGELISSAIAKVTEGLESKIEAAEARIKGDLVEDRVALKTLLSDAEKFKPEAVKGDPGEPGEPGPQGEPGLPGEKGDPGPLPSAQELEDIMRPLIPEAVQGEKGDRGEPGKDGSTPDIGDVVNRTVELLTPLVTKLIPDPVKGDPGEPGEPGPQGEPGAPGEDGPIPDMKAIVKALLEDEACRDLIVKSLAGQVHKGTYDPAASYDIGNEVVMRGSTYRKVAATNEDPPGQGWQMISQGKIGKKGLSGEPGIPGAPGAPGAPGIGIKSVIVGDGQLIIEYDNEDQEVLEVEDLHPRRNITGAGGPPSEGGFDGQVYFDTKTKQAHIWTGAKWERFK